jgi:acetyltransferase-like isoleucine patch superfamily enzyme
MKAKKKTYTSQGSGKNNKKKLGRMGKNVILEDGVRLFHPERIFLGHNIYIGHDVILKAYHKNDLIIEDNSWIGPGCFLHSAGGIRIGQVVGIGPMVKIISSYHEETKGITAVMDCPLVFKPVILEDGCDIGTGAIILPGVTVGRGAIVGAGAVVTKDIPAFSIAAGVPAKVLRKRII